MYIDGFSDQCTQPLNCPRKDKPVNSSTYNPLLIGIMRILKYIFAITTILWQPLLLANPPKVNGNALKPGHGYLLVAIESLGDTPQKILIKGPQLFSNNSIENLIPGNNYRLIEVPTGSYSYNQIYTGGKKSESFYWDILSFDYSIKVRPNTISYAGHLISEMYSDTNVDFNFRNRSSQAFEYIKSCCLQLSKSYPLVFTGSYPDPFLDFLSSSETDSTRRQ